MQLILGCNRFAIICSLKPRLNAFLKDCASAHPQLCLDSDGTKEHSVGCAVGKAILDGYSYPRWP